MRRRHFLQASGGLLTLAGTTRTAAADTESDMPVFPPAGKIYPYHARQDRITAFNICTRPFRARGPRIELERIGRKDIVHNYGHGGSGWSLSWGSAELATDLALTTQQNEVAVIGCGAIGLTTAITAQRAGLAVRIYAKERPPYVRSSFATGVWSPDSRICTLEHAVPFAQAWEKMTRTSHRRFQFLLGLPGHPVEWTTIYQLGDKPFDAESPHEESLEPEYPRFSSELVPELTPDPVDLSPDQHPFRVAHARRNSLLMFNISTYSRLLLEEFQLAGGHIHTLELNSAEDFRNLDERTIINCTGYGARALLNDDSIIPVRGQTCRMIPQAELNYGIRYSDQHVFAYPRRDGILVQAGADDDFGNASTEIDPQESISAVQRLGNVMKSINPA